MRFKEWYCGHYFRTMAQVYGASPFAEEADYMGAYCYYMTSPRPELDQENTVQAIQAFQLHLIKYPDSKRAITSLFLKAFTLDNDLHQFEEAGQYYRLFLEKYPNNEFAESAQFLLENLGKSEEELKNMLMENAEKNVQ